MAGYIGSRASVVSSGAERKKTFDITGTTTSLTGLSYTVNQVHVFHNGVRLVDGTDFTATNGSSITLTSAAESGDEVVVISYAGYQVSDTVSASQGGTFAGDVTVSGAFTSQGIDDNATSTAMTLDASGNLLVGKSSQNIGSVGFEATPSSVFQANASTASGKAAHTFNRLSSDGDIATFRKDGSTVGSIGSNTSGSRLHIGKDNVALSFAAGGANSIIPWDSTANAVEDATLNLGGSTARFKDLYLSGGVLLGGTGSANRLDSYEEGTWVPTIGGSATGPAVTYSEQVGRYVKIGSLVTVVFRCNLAALSGGTGNAVISGLPFAISGSFGNLYENTAVETKVLDYDSYSVKTVTLEAAKGQSYFNIMGQKHNANRHVYQITQLSGTTGFSGSITYITDS